MRRTIQAVAVLALLLLPQVLVHADAPTVITYQGALTDKSGKPANGPFSMTFRMYQNATGGAPVWTESSAGVKVTNGVFTVVLGGTTPLPAGLKNCYYLQVSVGGTAMLPRQMLTSAPFALGIAAGAQATGSRSDFALGAQNSSTANGAAGLYALANGATGQTRGVYGQTNSTSGNAAGLYGLAWGSTGATHGVYGQTDSTTNHAAGVYGLANGATGVTWGVFGQTNSTTDLATGVYGAAYGSTGATCGVYGETRGTGDNAAGLFGIARGTTGVTHGVWGQTLSTTDSAAGVAALATGASGTTVGVWARVESPDGHAIRASCGNQNAYGLYVVNGKSHMGGPVDIQSTLDVTGNATFHGGVSGQTNSTTDSAAGVSGLANGVTGRTLGVYGRTDSTSPDAAGVSGLANGATGRTQGVCGQTNSTTNEAAGVSGLAVGATGETNGVYGQTDSTSDWATAVYGLANSAIGATRGVYGLTSSASANATGVHGFANAPSGATRGVFGQTNSPDANAAGVSGLGIARGVFGQTNSTTASAAGVSGLANGATGATNGVVGKTNSTTDNAAGVVGIASGPTGITHGVWGQTNSTTDSTAAVGAEATGTSGATVGVWARVESPNGHALRASCGDSNAYGLYVVNGKSHMGGPVDMQSTLDVTGYATFHGGHGDLAENYRSQGVEAGDVVVIGKGGVLVKCAKEMDTTVAGIVSTQPSMTLEGRLPRDQGVVPLALVGRVACKVDATRAPIKAGDLLTTSSNPGHAMKARNARSAAGAIIGKALEGLESGTGVIQVLVTLR